MMLTGGLGVGDLARNTALRQSNGGLQKGLARAMQEATTGIAADRSARLSGDHRLDAQLNGSLTLLAAFRTANAEAALLSGTMQTALATVQDELQASTSAALTGASTGSTSAAATDVRARLSTAISALNVQIGGRGVFAGTSTSGSAMLTADAMFDGLTAAIAGESTAAGVAAKVAAWFDTPATYYTGSEKPLSPLQLSQGETARLDLTAADPAIREVLKGMALAALAEGTALPHEQVTSLMQHAGEVMANAAQGLATTSARVGTVEARISEATARNTAEETSVKLAQATLTSVDPYDASTKLEATETQLQTLYAITARLSSLSLADYLR